MTVNEIHAKFSDLQKQSKGLYEVVIPRGLVDNDTHCIDVRDDEKKVSIV